MSRNSRPGITTLTEPALILASTSPYRRELLARLGIPFDAAAPGTDETRQPGEEPRAMVARLACAKAAVIAEQHPDAAVIGSDQCAVLKGLVLGKPGSVDRAVSQLEAASGQKVRFLTAVAVQRGTQVHELVDETVVTFRRLDRAEIERYVERELPLDCAGSFKSEGLGITLFERIENEDPSALMGLPLIGLCRLLREAGFTLP